MTDLNLGSGPAPVMMYFQPPHLMRAREELLHNPALGPRVA